MASDYARLLIDLEANTRKFVGPMNEAAGKINSFHSGIKRMAGALVGVFAVGAVVGYANRVADAADAQNKLARRLGITKGEVDALELSFMKGGQTLQSAEKALDIFNRTLGKFEAGEKTAIDAFNRLGLSAENFAGVDYNQRLIMVKKSLDGMTTSARAFASQELFGRGGAKMYEGLKALEATDAMVKNINKELGLTGDAVVGIEEMNDRFTETKKTLELITTSILVEMSSQINDLALGAGKIALQFGKIAQFRLAAGAASEMAGGGIKGWWAAMQLAPNEMEETLAKWESYKAELEKGVASPRGGMLPLSLDQVNAKAEFEKNKKAAESAAALDDGETDEDLQKYVDKVKQEAIPAIDTLRNSYKMLEDAAAQGLLSKPEKISGMAAAWDAYKKSMPDSTDTQQIVELQIAIKNLQEQHAAGAIDASPFQAQLADLESQLAGAQVDKEGRGGFVEYMKQMYEGIKMNQEAMEQWNQDFQGFSESVMAETQSPLEKFMEHVWKLDTVLQAGMITADAYWKSLTGAFADLQNSAGMQYMQNMTQSLMTMGQLVPSSGVQMGGIGESRYQAPGQAASMSASEAASMMGGGLEDIGRQQLTTQKNIESGISQVAYLLSRGLI